MSPISYAQNQEDVVLDRLFPQGSAGFYIDIGAHDPTSNSVTRHFYDLGWHGINVEPAKAAFERLAAARTRDININSGVSDEEGELTFYEALPESGLSTFDQEQAESHIESGVSLVERTAPVTTLARICEEHVEGTIDFLTIDVEGFEEYVLRGADWKRWRPRVVIVEATRPGTSIPSHGPWEPVLLDADYRFATFDGLNRYYVRSEDAELVEALKVPANFLDGFVPYEFARRIGEAHEAQRELAAIRAMNMAFRAETSSFRHQLAFLHAEYRRLEAQHRELELALEAGRTQYEAIRTTISEVQGRYEQLGHEMAAALEQVGATQQMIAGAAGTVARSLSGLAQRFPQTGSLVKASLRAAREVTRQLRPPSG